MRGLSRGRGLLVAVALGLPLSLGSLDPLFAQGDAPPPAWVQTLAMPEGWETASWDTFTQDLVTLAGYLDSSGRWDEVDPDHYDAVLERGWVFLQDQPIMGSGDLALVTQLVERVGSTHADYDDGRAEAMQGLWSARLQQEANAAAAAYADFYRSLGAMRSAGLDDPAEFAGYAAAYAGNTDLTQISAGLRMELYGMSAHPVVNLDAYSARFTGAITLPAAGEYRFSRFDAPPSDGDWMKVTIGETVVLDTSLSEENAAVMAEPVQLSAGAQPVSIEYSRERGRPGVLRDPELILMWTTPGQEPPTSLVPSTVFQTSGGGGNSGGGLDAVYYGAPGFEGDPVHTEVIPSLQYQQGGFADANRAGVDAVRSILLDPQHDADWAASTLPEDAALPMWHTLRGMQEMGLEDRKRVLDMLASDHSEMLAKFQFGYFSNTLALAAAVPGDTAVDLLQAWAQGRPRFTTQPAIHDGRARGGYLRTNNPHLINGRALQPLTMRQWSVIEQMRDTCLTEVDGTCDLEVLKLLLICYSFSPDHSVEDLAGYVQARIDNIDPGLPGAGDRLASWYLGQALCAEHGIGDFMLPSPLIDERPYELAFAAAESADVRFWVLSEHAARLASLGRVDQLDQLLNGPGQGFTDPDQVAALAHCADVARQIVADAARDSSAAEVARLKRALDLLMQRLSAAQENGNQAEIERYAPRVEAAQAAYGSARAAFDAAYPEQ